MLGALNKTNAAVGSEIGEVALGPIGSAAGALIGGLIDENGPLKQSATVCANNAEYACQANLGEWNNYPNSVKTTALKTQYLNQALEIWEYLEQCCGQPTLGSAGSRCISERDHGGKYDFWVSCYDPINNTSVIDSDINTSVPISPVLVSANNIIPQTSVVNSATGVTESLTSFVESNPLIDLGIAGLLLLLIL